MQQSPKGLEVLRQLVHQHNDATLAELCERFVRKTGLESVSGGCTSRTSSLRKRLGKFGFELEPSKTKLVEFGRFAQRHACRRGRKRPETIYFLGFTLYCTRNRKGKCHRHAKLAGEACSCLILLAFLSLTCVALP